MRFFLGTSGQLSSRLILILLCLALSIALLGCGSAPGTIQRLTAQQVKDGLDRGEYQVVDARSDSGYQLSHIKGAIPLSRANVITLSKDRMVVMYCS